MKGIKIGELYKNNESNDAQSAEERRARIEFIHAYRNFGERFSDASRRATFENSRMYTVRGLDHRIPENGELTPEQRGILCAYAVQTLKYGMQPERDVCLEPGFNVFDAMQVLERTGNLHTSNNVGGLIQDIVDVRRKGDDSQGSQRVLAEVERYVKRHQEALVDNYVI